MFRIEQETSRDWWEVEYLFDTSFAPGREALSSYSLRRNVAPIAELCLVARDNDSILAGAIRFWPVAIGEDNAPALILGPVAVHPTRQGEGLGGLLIRESLQIAKKLGWIRVILIGDEPYYSKFGFKKAAFLEFPPPTNPDRLLAFPLEENAFDGVQGLIKSTASVAGQTEKE